MPSILQPWCRDYPYDARVKNLAKALSSPRYHPPRPWRSKDEAYMIRRYAFWWWTCRDSNKPSGRSWARQLGVSHTWLQRLVREFQRNPDEMWRHVQQTTMSVHLPRLGGFLEDLAAGVLPLHLHRNNDRKTPARFRIVPTWKVTPNGQAEPRRQTIVTWSNTFTAETQKVSLTTAATFLARS